MLTRLRVRGFKNLADVDVRLGPFTSIAGVNGAGKSNLLDAIAFLRALAGQPLVDAALSVCDDIRGLFHRGGDGRILLEAEMLVPKEGVDELGQPAEATITFLRYAVELGYRRAGPGLEILREDLSHIRKSDAHEHLLFPHRANTWRADAVTGRESGHRTAPFLSTETVDGRRCVLIHQDGEWSGRLRPLAASDLPRTVLSAAGSAENPTAMLARREIRSWRVLHLEPSRLRRPDPLTATPYLNPDGSHLSASLYRIANTPAGGGPEAVYARIANRLAEFGHVVGSLSVERDETRELLALAVRDRDGIPESLRAQPAGLLRYLALAVLAEDPEAMGLVCVEEPENGIHPGKIPVLLRLLQSMATNPFEHLSATNPLRQVIITTHSPLVMNQLSREDVLLAESRDVAQPEDARSSEGLVLLAMPDTWRASLMPVASPGAFQQYSVLPGRPRPRVRAAEDDEANLPIFGDWNESDVAEP